jgi:hypothetical protein
MVSVKELEKLNRRIENINKEYTKKKTQQDMLKERLSKEIAAYKKEYNVSLEGKSIAETKKKIIAEHKRLVSEVESEYSLKLQVVQAIEEGDYDEAAKLLGIEPEVEEVEEDEDPVEEEVEDEEATTTATEDIEVDEDDDEEIDFGIDEDDEEEEEESFGSDEAEVEDEGFNMEVEDEDSEVEEVSAVDFMKAAGIKKPEPDKKSTEVKGSAPKDAFADMPDVEEDIFGDMEVEDDDDEVDFGFGDMLSGTKFE